MSKMIPGKTSVVYHVRRKRNVPKLTITKAIESVPRDEYKLLRDSVESVSAGKGATSEAIELMYNIGRGNVKVELYHPTVDHTIAIGYDHKVQDLVVAYARPRNGVDTFSRSEGSARSLARLEKAIYGNKNGTEVPRYYIGQEYASVPNAISVPLAVVETLKASVDKALLFFKQRTIKHVTVYTYDENGRAVLLDYTQKLFNRPGVIEIPTIVAGANALLDGSWEGSVDVDALTLRQTLPSSSDVTKYVDHATDLLSGLPERSPDGIVDLSPEEKIRAFNEAAKDPVVVAMQKELLKSEIKADPRLQETFPTLARVDDDKKKAAFLKVDKVINPSTGKPYTRSYVAKEFGVSVYTIGKWIVELSKKVEEDKKVTAKRVKNINTKTKAIKAIESAPVKRGRPRKAK